MPININDFDTTAMLTNEERQELFLHILTNQEVFEAARQTLDPNEHLDQFEKGLAAVFRCSNNAVRAGGTITLPLESLRTEVSSDLERSRGLDRDDYLDLFGSSRLPSWVRKEFPDAELYEDTSENSFFDRLECALASGLDATRGCELLRRFLLERHLIHPIRELLSCPQIPTDPKALLDEIQRRTDYCEAIRESEIPTVGDEWDEHEQWLQAFRGRDFIGLRTGMAELDRRTNGLRELLLLGAGPGVGKTDLSIAMSLGVCAHYEENDAVVVFVSLEMDRKTIQTRIKANLADLDKITLMQGSRSVQHLRPDRALHACPDGDRERDLEEAFDWFDEHDRERLCQMQHRFREEQIGRRMKIIDREQIRERDFVGHIARQVRSLKESVGASRALVIVDYLQVLPVPLDIEKGGDLSTDRYRVSMLQDLLAEIQTSELPDCVLSISEARKPTKLTDTWGQGLGELMGSARLGYAASGVLLYGSMDDAAIKRYFGEHRDPQALRENCERTNRALVELTLIKGRDGTQRGSWGVLYRYHRSRFAEINAAGLCPSDRMPYGPNDLAEDQCTRDSPGCQSPLEQNMDEDRPSPKKKRARKKRRNRNRSAQ